MTDRVPHTSEDGKTWLDLRVEGQTVWLSQLEIAELFQTTKQNVSLHAKNILEEAELSAEATVKESLTVQAEGKREPLLADTDEIKDLEVLPQQLKDKSKDGKP